MRLIIGPVLTKLKERHIFLNWETCIEISLFFLNIFKLFPCDKSMPWSLFWIHTHIDLLYTIHSNWSKSLQWRQNGFDSVSNHQPHDCLLKRLFRLRSKKTPKLRVTGFCAGNSPETGEFPAQRARNAENVSIWWRHHVCPYYKESSEDEGFIGRLSRVDRDVSGDIKNKSAEIYAW